MRINLFNTYYPKYTLKPSVNYHLSPLQCDTVSFTSMKKKEFEGIDYAVVEKFKAPIEKFNTNEDLQNWASEKLDEIVEKDYGGRQEETRIQRKALVKEWADYVTKENDAYTPAMALLIMNFVTEDLKDNTDDLLPTLNKGVLAGVIDNLQTTLKNNPKEQFDPGKIYKNMLRSHYLEDTDTGEKGSKWVIIPSKAHDPENFEANVEKLKALSHKNWCTKSFNAEPYLSEGDFHVYLEDSKPKIGVRFVDDEIQEIQGEKNNGKIPFNYYEKVKEHVRSEQLTNNAYKQMETSKVAAKKAKKVIQDLKPAIEKNDTATILTYFGIDCEKDKDGLYIISHYTQPEDFNFSDLGINENKLFKKIKKIEECADFSGSQITNLGNLENIGNCADFRDSQVTNLGNLKNIGNWTDFRDSQVTNLGNLQSIGGNAYFNNSKVTNLGGLETIGGDAVFSYSQVTNLGSLQSVGRNTYCDAKIKHLFESIDVKGKIFVKS